jgi:Na+/melibiose symporter-like transporter
MLFILTALGMIVIAIAAQRVLKRRKKRPEIERPPFDLTGAVLFSSLLTAGLLTLTLGPRAGWAAPQSVLGLLLFLALLAGFVVVERRHEAPMLDFGLFRNGAFALGALAAVVAFMCISSMRFLAPFFFQGVKGYSPTHVGMLMLPAAMTTAISAPFVGRIADSLGVRFVANIGLAIALLGLSAFLWLEPSTPTWLVVAALVVVGLGMSSFGAPNSASILNSVSADAHGVAAGFVNLCRNTGNVIGIAFGTAVVTLTMTDAGFAASLADVDIAAGQAVLDAFTRGARIAAMALLSLAVPVLVAVVAWTIHDAGRRSERDEAAQ